MNGPSECAGATRRQVLAAGAGALSLAITRPARATPETMAAAIKAFVGEADVRKGRVSLDIPPLVENGNSVPVTVTVESPMTPADFVKSIALFNERNPQPNVAHFHLGPRPGAPPCRRGSAWRLSEHRCHRADERRQFLVRLRRTHRHLTCMRGDLTYGTRPHQCPGNRQAG